MVLWFGVTLWLLQVGIRCHISQERWVARCYIQCITVRAPLYVHAVEYICVSVAFLNKEGPAVCIYCTHVCSLCIYSDLCVAESGGIIRHELRRFPSTASDCGGNGINCLLFDGHPRISGAVDVSRICNDKDRARISSQFK